MSDVRAIIVSGFLSKESLIDLYKSAGIVSLASGTNWDAFEEEVQTYNIVGKEKLNITHDRDFDMVPGEREIYRSIIRSIEQSSLGDASGKLSFRWLGGVWIAR